MRAYIRVDPELADKKCTYPDGAFAAFVITLCSAEQQPQRGRFKTVDILKAYLGVRARWIPFLVAHGDLVQHQNGSLYFDGWDEWQEGDWKVKERVQRIRARVRVTTPVTADVTVPVTAGTVNAPQSASTKPSERKAVGGKAVSGKHEPPIGPPVGTADALVLVPPVSLTPTDQVFEAWRQMWHPTAKLTRERRTKIEARLREGWSTEDLIEAVTTGAANDPWAERHLALNDDIKNLLRNGSAVEKFLGLARQPLSVLPPARRTLAQSYREQAATLRARGD